MGQNGKLLQGKWTIRTNMGLGEKLQIGAAREIAIETACNTIKHRCAATQ